MCATCSRRLSQPLSAVVALSVVVGIAAPAAAQTADPQHVGSLRSSAPAGPAGSQSAQVYAQTGYIPYFGKNKIRYNNFKWHIYTTDHFEVYYYPEIEQHLERVVSYAESAYQTVSSDLKHDLGFKVPLMLYKTQSEFQQQNI
jgi:hypothetical protein